MKNDGRYVVAVKKITANMSIIPGRVLGTYRKIEFARRDRSMLAARAGFGSSTWRTGIFHQGKLVEG